MKPNDIVLITKGQCPYFKTGDKAKLLKLEKDGSWKADFTINEKYYDNGIWYLQPGVAEWKLIKD